MACDKSLFDDPDDECPIRAEKATVADACRIAAGRTRDQQAQDVLFQAARELGRLTAELAQHQPEERVGECGCGHCRAHYTGKWRVGLSEMWLAGTYCPICGDLLDRDGIARRNADTARVDRVREALDKYLPGAIRERWMSLGGFVPQSVEDALPTICQTADAIRAALDPEAKQVSALHPRQPQGHTHNPLDGAVNRPCGSSAALDGPTEPPALDDGISRV